jgi:hypothetical protein
MLEYGNAPYARVKYPYRQLIFNDVVHLAYSLQIIGLMAKKLHDSASIDLHEQNNLKPKFNRTSH